MSKALEEIERLRALIQWCCNWDYIWKIHEPLKVDFRIRIMRRDQTNERPQTMGREISRPE
jgi:hypothetical protein